MLSELNNSVKAKLFDFTYTPFMSSLFISWIVLNHKYLLIYYSTSDIDKKLIKLNEYDFSFILFEQNIPNAMNFYFPIFFGLFYVFIYPYASKMFYEFTLNKTKDLKRIKQQIHDKTPILQEEAQLIYSEIDRLKKERDDALEKLAKYESKNKTVNIDAELKKYKEVIGDIPIEDDKTKILRFFYESNYSGDYKDGLINRIVESTHLARPKILKIYNELKKDLLLKKDNNEHINITDLGNEKLLELFD